MLAFDSTTTVLIDGLYRVFPGTLEVAKDTDLQGSQWQQGHSLQWQQWQPSTRSWTSFPSKVQLFRDRGGRQPVTSQLMLPLPGAPRSCIDGPPTFFGSTLWTHCLACPMYIVYSTYSGVLEIPTGLWSKSQRETWEPAHRYFNLQQQQTIQRLARARAAPGILGRLLRYRLPNIPSLPRA